MSWVNVDERLPKVDGDFWVKWTTGEQERKQEFRFKTFFCLVTHWWEGTDDEKQNEDWFDVEQIITMEVWKPVIDVPCIIERIKQKYNITKK